MTKNEILVTRINNSDSVILKAREGEFRKDRPISGRRV